MQLLRVWLTGAPFFFMFHMGTKAHYISLYLPVSPLEYISPLMLPMGTKAHYFDSTLKFGGAKYRPTGRGFVMIHEQV